MEWLQVLFLFVAQLGTAATVIGLVLWFVKNAKEETTKWEKKSREDWKMCHSMIQAIQTEMKDFHQRLYELRKEGK